jgi:hypothetical protein
LGVEYATSWSFVLAAPVVAAAFPVLALLLVTSDEPPQPARAAAAPTAESSVSKDVRVVNLGLKSGTPCVGKRGFKDGRPAGKTSGGA